MRLCVSLIASTFRYEVTISVFGPAAKKSVKMHEIPVETTIRCCLFALCFCCSLVCVIFFSMRFFHLKLCKHWGC